MLSAEAASAGLMSAHLAQRNFTSPDEVLAGAKGYANAHAEHADASVASAGLGTDYEILSLAYKPYPCGIVVHQVIDVCLDLVRAHDFTPDEIAEVALKVPAVAMNLTGRKDPTDGDKAGTSIYHWAAAALLHRTAGLAQGTTDCVRDPRVLALRTKVSADVEPTLAADAARAEIRLTDGRVLHGHVEHARGSVSRPLTDDELSEKFLGQAKLIFSEDIAHDLLTRCWNLLEAPDVAAAVAPMLTPSPSR
jgi:2-methylcitrate dehydratase PrpD